MKAKYQHNGNDCMVYDYIICVDNIVVTVRINQITWTHAEQKTTTTVHITNAEARRVFWHLCQRLEKEGYECVYKEE